MKIADVARPAARSVSSTITTASAPSGIGAPVAISMHSPAPIDRVRHLAGVDLLDAIAASSDRSGRRRTCPRRAPRSRPSRRDRTAARPSRPWADAAITRPVASPERHAFRPLDRRTSARRSQDRCAQRSRPSGIGLAGSARMVASSFAWTQRRSLCELPHEVAELGEDQLRHRQPDGVLGSRQDEDRGAARDAGGGARHHRGAADLLVAEHPEQLAEAVEPLLEQAGDRFVGAVARGDAGAAGRDDRVDAADLRRAPTSCTSFGSSRRICRFATT